MPELELSAGARGGGVGSGERFNYVMGPVYPYESCYGKGPDPTLTMDHIDNLTFEDVRKLRLVNAPLTVDHPPLNCVFKDTPQIQCGKVTHSFLDGNDLWAVAQMKESRNPETQVLFEKIRRGEEVGLSLGLRYSDLRDATDRILQKNFAVDHLAFAAKPRRPRCYVYKFETEETAPPILTRHHVSHMMQKVKQLPRRRKFVINASDGSSAVEISNSPQTCDLGVMFKEGELGRAEDFSNTTGDADTDSLMSFLSKNKRELSYKADISNKTTTSAGNMSLAPLPALGQMSSGAGGEMSVSQGQSSNQGQQDQQNPGQFMNQFQQQQQQQQQHQQQQQQNSQQQRQQKQPDQQDQQDEEMKDKPQRNDGEKGVGKQNNRSSQEESAAGDESEKKRSTPAKPTFQVDKVLREMETKDPSEQARIVAELANQLQSTQVQYTEQAKEFQRLKEMENVRDKKETVQAADLVNSLLMELLPQVDPQHITSEHQTHHKNVTILHENLSSLFKQLPSGSARHELAQALNQYRGLFGSQTQALSVASAEQGRLQQEENARRAMERAPKRKRVMSSSGIPDSDSISSLIDDCRSTPSSRNSSSFNPNSSSFTSAPFPSYPMTPLGNQTHMQSQTPRDPYFDAAAQFVGFGGDNGKLQSTTEPLSSTDGAKFYPNQKSYPNGWDFSSCNFSRGRNEKPSGIAEFIPMNPQL